MTDTDEIRLGPMGIRIMSAVWDRGRATVREVTEAISEGEDGPAYNTVLTMMRKLEAKGYLRHDVDGRTFVYEAMISRQAVRQNVLGNLIERLFEGSPELLVSNLIARRDLSAKELKAIQRLIAERGKDHGRDDQ
jgi:BlaI family penicillinase repressor